MEAGRWPIGRAEGTGYLVEQPQGLAPQLTSGLCRFSTPRPSRALCCTPPVSSPTAPRYCTQRAGRPQAAKGAKVQWPWRHLRDGDTTGSGPHSVTPQGALSHTLSAVPWEAGGCGRAEFLGHCLDPASVEPWLAPCWCQAQLGSEEGGLPSVLWRATGALQPDCKLRSQRTLLRCEERDMAPDIDLA